MTHSAVGISQVSFARRSDFFQFLDRRFRFFPILVKNLEYQILLHSEFGHNFVCYVITMVITKEKRQTGCSRRESVRNKTLKGLVNAARTEDTHILYFNLY